MWPAADLHCLQERKAKKKERLKLKREAEKAKRDAEEAERQRQEEAKREEQERKAREAAAAEKKRWVDGWLCFCWACGRMPVGMSAVGLWVCCLAQSGPRRVSCECWYTLGMCSVELCFEG